MTRAAAEELGLVVKIFEARSPDGLEPAFDAMASAGFKPSRSTRKACLFKRGLSSQGSRLHGVWRSAPTRERHSSPAP